MRRTVIDDDGHGETTYESVITTYDGIQVSVLITIPTRATWGASGERAAAADALPPIAQMAAADAMKQIDKARNEVPF